MLHVQYQPFLAWDALAVTGTNTYKGAVSVTVDRNVDHEVEFTSTAAGELGLEVNNMTDAAYRVACGVAEDVVPSAAQEAANTQGWLPRLVYDKTSTSGTIAITAGAKVPVRAKKGPRRSRLTYTNATGSGTVTDRAQVYG